MELRRERLKTHEIAAALKCSRTLINLRVHQAGAQEEFNALVPLNERKDVTVERILALRAKGFTIRAIATELKISPERLYVRMRAAGASWGDRRMKGKRFDITPEMIFAGWEAGKHTKSICAELNCTKKVIWRLLRHHQDRLAAAMKCACGKGKYQWHKACAACREKGK